VIHPNNIRQVFHVACLDCLFCLHFVYCTRFPAQQLCVVLVIVYFEILKTSLINHLLWLDDDINLLKRVTVCGPQDEG